MASKKEIEKALELTRKDSRRMNAIIRICRRKLGSGWWFACMANIHLRPTYDARKLIDKFLDKAKEQSDGE